MKKKEILSIAEVINWFIPYIWKIVNLREQ